MPVFVLSALPILPPVPLSLSFPFLMLVFRGEYDSLFKECQPNDTAHKDGSTIINGILLWSMSLDTLLAYFECVCSVFMKYTVSLFN
jgi:hypothetical protein